MEGRKRGFKLWPLVPFIAVVTSFGSATVYSQWTARTIDEAALGIATNVSPSIENLSEARAELRRMQLALSEYIGALPSGQERSLAEYQDARDRVESRVRAYLALPPYAGERVLWAEVSA